MSSPLYIGIDVGTGSVRAGLFTSEGEKIGYCEHAITTRNKKPSFYEQSGEDIWRATEHCVRSALKGDGTHAAGALGARVAALGIDATCSLVACTDDDARAPLSVTDDGGDGGDGDVFNILLWLDQRAVEEAGEINRHRDAAVQNVVRHFGGAMSPENEPPKLLWLARHKPDLLSKGVFYDLADWLAYKFCAGGRDARSACTVACKWGWGCGDETERGAWDAEFWRVLGLSELVERDFAKIGRDVRPPGATLGRVRRDVANRLGLRDDCVVGVPMIDAHAGALWALGVRADDGAGADAVSGDVTRRLSMICGTSTCYIQVSGKPVFVPGVWGPFRDALVAGMHVAEGGQSVSGKLLECTVRQHAAYNGLAVRVGASKVYAALEVMGEGAHSDAEDAAAHVHVLDYHAGNRSPVGDATLTGATTGQTLDASERALAVLFRATVQSLACGARHIVETLRDNGHGVETIMMCGGLTKSELYVQSVADCVGVPVALAAEADTVLLGSAVLARAAAEAGAEDGGAEDGGAEDGGVDSSARLVVAAAAAMSRCGRVVLPDAGRREYYRRKYGVYRKLQGDNVEYRRMMRGESGRST